MNKILLSLIFICVSHYAFSQIIEIKKYHEGQLNLSDFKGKILDIDSLVGQAYFDITSDTEIKKVDDIEFTIPKYTAIFYPFRSWLKMNNFSGTELMYFQGLFDIEEIYARQCNQYLNSNLFEIEQNQFEIIYQDKEIKKQQYILESNYGSRKDKIQEWLEIFDKELETINLSDTNANIKLESTVGMSGYLGVQKLFNSKELGNTFNNPISFKMGFNFFIKKHLIAFDFSFASSKLKNDLGQSPFWEKGVRVNQAFANIHYGRKFSLSNKFNVGFTVGPSLNNFYLNFNKYEDIYANISNTKWNIGGSVFIDLILSKKYKLDESFSRYSKVYAEYGIRFKVDYIAPTNIYDQYKGSSTGISVNGYYYFGQLSEKPGDN